ncbi:hypothetical protein [Actinomadura chokoriensis]|uniref:hypothetical protein n=1 Tax=Actinomadura chokoriensis TaxID=454156 RepID=UPI0031FA0E8B
MGNDVPDDPERLPQRNRVLIGVFVVLAVGEEEPVTPAAHPGPVAAGTALAALDDMRAALIWVPDAVIALWTASAAGTAVAALRIVRARRRNP